MEKTAHRQLLAEIASMYYSEKKTQAIIGKEFGYSRSAISRLLLEAEKQGIVKITIDFPIQRDSSLEQRLVSEFGLETAYVIKQRQFDYDQSLRGVGRLGAMYLEQHLHSDMVIGIGWGTSVYEVVNSLPYIPLKDVSVVQVIGAIGSKSDTKIDGPEIASFFASKLDASYQSLHSPLYLNSKKACDSLKSQKQILDTFKLAYKSDMVLLGVGTIDVDSRFSSLFRSGFINEREVNEIKRKGGVCNFCGIILDEKGSIMDIDMNHRSMAVDIKSLKNNKCKVIGIAAGYEKREAIRAILNGGWLDILVTDQNAIFPIMN